MDNQDKKGRVRRENSGYRIESEKKIVGLMIELYCQKKHGQTKELCEDCQTILNYAKTRLNQCRFGEEKKTCQKCPVHCYRKDMKQQIKLIMRFSGPRMIIYHPIEAVRHLIRNKQAIK